MIGRKGYSPMLQVEPHLLFVEAKRICDIPIYNIANISNNGYHRQFICTSSVDSP